ncbi:MAG: hypothetical protein GXP21_07865 [Gammaproteobacteria bacterium]|nr:hypothetical protein [Gammaproteobacteria bacterium]
MTTVKKTIKSTTNTKAQPRTQSKAGSTVKEKKPAAAKAVSSKLVSRHAVLGFSSRRVWPD